MSSSYRVYVKYRAQECRKKNLSFPSMSQISLDWRAIEDKRVWREMAVSKKMTPKNKKKVSNAPAGPFVYYVKDMRKKLPHLPYREALKELGQRWKTQVSREVKEEYARKSREKYHMTKFGS